MLTSPAISGANIYQRAAGKYLSLDGNKTRFKLNCNKVSVPFISQDLTGFASILYPDKTKGCRTMTRRDSN